MSDNANPQQHILALPGPQYCYNYSEGVPIAGHRVIIHQEGGQVSTKTFKYSFIVLVNSGKFNSRGQYRSHCVVGTRHCLGCLGWSGGGGQIFRAINRT